MKDTFSTVVKLVFIFALFFCTYTFSPSATLAVTYTDPPATQTQNSAQVQSLMQQIMQLQQVLINLIAQKYAGCVNLTRTLALGSSDGNGSEVSQLQKFLKAQGDYTGTISGTFGPVTQVGVRKFQARKGIISFGPNFGVVGPATRAKIRTITCPNGVPPVIAAITFPPIDPNSSIASTQSSTSTNPNQNPNVNQNPNQNNNNTTPPSTTITYPAPSTKQFLVQEPVTPAVMGIASGLGGQKSYVFGADPENDGTVSTSYMDQFIALIPAGFTGYAVIDLEDPFTVWLREPVASAHFQQAQTEMLKAINYARQQRPYTKWSFYSIPTVLYWVPTSSGNKSWVNATPAEREAEKEIMRRPTALFNAMDFIAPSIYPAYPDATTPNIHEHDIAFVQNAIAISLEVAHGKAVLPYITHRFYNGWDPAAYGLVPWNEFQDEQLTTALNAGAHGVIWWGSDLYLDWIATASDATLQANCVHESPNNVAGCLETYIHYRTLINSHFITEIPSGMNHAVYFDLLHEQYARLIAESLYNIPYTPIPITLNKPLLDSVKSLGASVWLAIKAILGL